MEQQTSINTIQINHKNNLNGASQYDFSLNHKEKPLQVSIINKEAFKGDIKS